MSFEFNVNAQHSSAISDAVLILCVLLHLLLVEILLKEVKF